MSLSSATKARRSLTEQFEMLYGANPNASTNRNSTTRSPSGLSGGGRALSPQAQYRPNSVGHGLSLGPEGNMNSFAFFHEALRNHAAELELERRTREAAVRDLSARTTVEVGELREMIRQLRQDNNALKEQVWSLERRKVPAGGSGSALAPGDGYFGGSAALTNVQMPLIPRVTDLETGLEQLRQKVARLQSTEKSREESLQKALVEQQMQQREALDQAKEYARLECDRRDASRIDPLDQQMRDVVASQHDLQRAIAKVQSETSATCVQLGERMRASEDALAAGLNDRQTQQQLDEWKRLMKATAEVEADKLKTTVSDLKADITKVVRKQEAGDLEVQEALQAFIGQRVDVLRAEMLPREEMAKIHNALTSAQKDADRAVDLAQSAKVSAEEARREITKRVIAVESDVSSLSAKTSQLANDTTNNSQTIKATVVAVEEVRSAIKATQSALSDHSDRITSTTSRYLEQTTVTDALSQDVARLKALQASGAITEGSERQQLKERLSAAEDEVKSLKSKLTALDESQQTNRKDAERALNDLRSTVSAEERAQNQLAQQKMQGSIAALENRFTSVDERCGMVEAQQQKVREELLLTIRTKVDSVKESLLANLSEADEACKARCKESKDAAVRVDEKSNSLLLKVRSIETAVELFPTMEAVERLTIEARDSATKAATRQHQELSREAVSLREELLTTRQSLERSLSDTQQEVRTRLADAASKAVVEDLRIRVDDVVAAIDQTEATMSTTINKAIRDRLKPLQDAQTSQKEEFDEFQTLVAELAQRLKTLASTTESHDSALKDHEKALEATEKSNASVFNELMMAVSVACSHEQQFGPSSTQQAPSQNGESTVALATAQVTIKSLGDVIQYILNCVADAQQEQQEQMEALERIRSASQATQQPTISEEDLHNALQTVSGPLMELTKIVDRHEVGFSTIHELVQGIRFNNKSIVAVATALGVETEGLKLRTLDDSELQEALSEAVNDAKEREYEITEKERHWM